MKLTYHNIFKSALFALAVPLSLASCSFDGDYDDCADQAGDVKTVRLQITANDPDEVANTRFSPEEDEIKGNEAGKDGEYINSLDIFIVSSTTSNNVVYASHLDATDLEGDAVNGKLTSYTSGPIELTDGTPYTVYAFANMSETYSQAWDGIASIAKGGTLSKTTLDAIVLDDPAGKLDFTNGNFIPMSATVAIPNLSSPVIDVSLDRLVSKIRLAVTKDNGVNVTSLKISGWADKVSLMDNADASASPSGTVFDCDKEFTSDELTKIDASTYDFYVNETPQNHHFTVEVKTKEQGSPVYTATTARDNLPRNCIYPLTLNINTLDLQLEAGLIFNPIGAHVLVDVVNIGSSFYIEIPDGWEFSLDAKLNVQSSSCTYTWTDEATDPDNDEFQLVDATGAPKTDIKGTDGYIRGVVPSLGLAEGAEGKTYVVGLNVEWMDSYQRSLSRSYTVNIKHIWDDEEYWSSLIEAAVESSTTTATYLQPETLNMVINH